MQSQMGTQEKGILMPGIDSCIVKDQKCPTIAEFGKKTCVNCQWRITYESLPCHFEHHLLITYMNIVNIASNLPLWLPSHFG